MSKECCGITYSDDETVCKVCGKELSESSRDLTDILADIELEGTKDYSQDIEDSADSEVTDVLTKDDRPHKYEDSVKEEAELDSDAQITEVLNSHGNMDEKSKAALKEFLDDKSNEEDSEDEASAGLKFAGVLSIFLAVAGLAAVAIGVYFLIVSPLYDKSKDVTTLDYPYIATTTDYVATPDEGGVQ